MPDIGTVRTSVRPGHHDARFGRYQVSYRRPCRYAAAGPSATQMLLPALPALQTDFAVDVGVAQLALSLSLLAMALVQIACGSWSDRIGRRPAALWGLVIYVLGSFVCLVAGNIWVLILGRIVQGAGGAFGMVLARAIVRDVYGPTKAASMISILTMAIVVAPWWRR